MNKWILVKTFLDMVLWGCVIYFAFDATMRPDSHKNSPVLFDVVHLTPYNFAPGITTFVDERLKNKVMCNDTAPSDACGYNSADNITTLAKTDLNCTGTASALPAYCKDCVELYASRIHTYGYGLADDAAIDVTATAFVKLKKELAGCIARKASWTTAEFTMQTNVWLHLLMWTTMAFTFSVSVASHEFITRPEKDASWWRLVAKYYAAGGIIAIAGTVLVFVLAFHGSGPMKENSALFDIVPVFIFQVCIVLAAGLGMLPFLQGNSLYFHDEKSAKHVATFTKRTLFFDTLLVVSTPSIAVIVCCYRGWLEYDMLVYFVTTTTMIIGLSMVDDVLNIFWSMTTTMNAIRQHTQVHMTLMSVVIVSIFLLWNSGLPGVIAGDPFYGTVHSTLFLFFLISMCLAPSLLHEFSTRDADEILYLKEGLELAYRVAIFLVMVLVLEKPDAGTLVP